MPPIKVYQDRKWWHSAAIYQVYPSSFKDSTSTGAGDIPGIISKIDHIASLGVDAVWLSPCYKSPNVDMGYDISDFCQINPQYGTLKDVEVLIEKLKEKNIKLIMDLVANHTSDQHAWFEESRSSKTNPKRDWYIWRKGRTEVINGETIRLPPNNWASLMQGSAWQYDATTDEFYLHIWTSSQPDLNWENAGLRRAVYDDMRFWLEKGVGGFRMDVINMISKVEGLPNAPTTDPSTPWQSAVPLFTNGPRIHEYIREMRREVLDQYEDIVTVGEAPFTHDPDVIRAYIHNERKELSMLFVFDYFGWDMGSGGKFTPSPRTLKDLKEKIAQWQRELPFSSGVCQACWLETHDAGRSVTRFGDRTPENRFRVAKMLAMLMTTVAGTVFVFQGQEIGMANLGADVPIDSYADIETKLFWQDIRAQRQAAAKPGEEINMSDVEEQVRLKARDHGRAPMPWKDSSHPLAGFSNADVVPWTPMNSDADICNVAAQHDDPRSVLSFWREMLAFRKEWAETIVFGDCEPVEATINDDPIFAYRRKAVEGTTIAKNLLVVLNMKAVKDAEFKLPGRRSERYSVVAATNGGVAAGRGPGFEGGTELLLSPYQGIILRVEA